MRHEQIRQLLRAQPFQPFTIHLPEGRAVPVIHHDFALVSPDALGLEMEPQGHQMPIALRVPDVDEARAKLEAEGIEFAHETIDSGVCHLATFHDPDGNALQLHRRYAP